MKGLSTLTRTKGGICMLKNLKKVAAIVLSFAMAVQFGLADSYYVNAVEEPVEPQQEETTTTTPQEQEEVPTAEEETPQQQEEQQQPAVEEEQPAPETKSVELSYVAEDGTVLHETASRDFNVDYSLKTDSSVMLNFDGYTLKDVIINNSQTVPADQANLSVTSDLVSVKFVYVSVNTKEDKQTSENNEQTKTEEASEDDAEADPETKEELPEYPAFDQSETAGNVVVHATAAEGVLPRDSKLVVKRITRKAILNAVEDTVSEKNKEMDSAVALDITIQNKDGVEIQPNGSVNISFENAAVSGDEINVYHVTDDASAVTEVATNTQSFDANHFSIYVITGEKEKPLTTFNFVDANGNIVSTQIVKTGDTLITPTAPDVAGKAFVGWYDGETKFEDFNTALTITETTTRTITAKYENALYVYFYNPAGTQIMRTEKVGDHYPHGYTDVSYDVDSTHKLVGWAAQKNGTTNIAASIAVPKGSTSVNVYAIIKEGYWVSFNSDGGSIIDSQFVLHGDTLTLGKDTTPTKPGYTFDGWYNGSAKVENGATVASSMTLTAHWKAAEVSYTVIHWWENADDNGYSFHESENKTGRTGTEANAKAKSYEGFKAQPVTKKTIKGDGSTIVSVYYKRNMYDVKFYSYSSWYTSSKEYADLRITAKYGQDISKKWPTYKGSSTWRTNDGSGAYQVNIGTMPLGGATFYGPKTGDEYETAYYYVEALPGEASDVTVSGIRYKLDHKDTSPGQGYYVTKEDQYPLTGFTFNKNSSTRIEGDYDNARFYYTRNTYKIKFINKGKEDKSVEKKYEQSISSENYTPTRPSSLPDYYEFDGWYDNELCEGDAFDFSGKKMPAQNVTLYAKWTAKKINLTYNLNNPEGDVVKGTKKVEAGTIANTVLPSATTTSDYSFAGWYYADGNGNITSDAYNTNEAITKDTSVIGKWLYNGELKVVYDPGTEGSNAKVPTDSNIYAGGAKVTVAKNATTTSKKKFLGWKLKGNLYHPGDAFEVNKDLAKDDNVITLTAIWGNEESSTTMSYNPGNGRGSVQTVPVKNNESVTLRSEKDFGYQAPETEGKEYYFAGWATSMDDAKNGKATYAAGQTVHVDVNGENVLYATWIEKTVITVKAKDGTATYDGKDHTVSGFEATTFEVNGNKYTVTGLSATVTGKDAGNYTNEVTGTAVVKDAAGNNVTKQFTVKTENGSLDIAPKSVTVTAENKTKVFGEADPELTATVAGTVGKDKVKYTVAREAGEDVGHYSVIPTGEEIQGNYKVTYKNGDFEITKAGTMTLTPELTGKDAEKVYDGQPLSGGATATVKEGTKITYSTDGGETWSETLPSITDVGTLNVTAKAENKNYEDVTVDYTLTVKHRKVTVTGNNGNKVYGEADPELTATVAGTVGKDKVKYTVAREAGEDVGHYSVIPTGEEIQGNYKVTYVVGTLTITSQSIDPGTDPEKPNPDYTGAKVNSPSDSVYDGNEHKWIPTVTDKADKKLKAGTDYTVEYSTSDFTNVGTIEVVIKGKGNYSGTVKRSYKVTPKEYTVTTDSATKTYSGTALTASGKVEGIVSGETVEFTTTGSQTEVGTSKNTYELVWKSAKATNYTLAKESIGKLTVKAKSIVPDDKDTPESEKTGITVNEPSDSKYDGKEHKEVLTVTDTKTGKELVAGTDYSVTYSSDLVNAGTVKVTVAGLGNYTGSFTKTYKITKRSVTLTSATVSKVYDGSALTNTSITVSGDGFVEGEGASYEVTGTQTEVGNSANAFEYKLNEKTLASNYNITKVVGTLTITAAPAPVTPVTPSTPSTPSSTTSTTPHTPSAPQVTTPVETVEKETTPKAEPKKEEKVEEEYTPKASPQYYWALINLICAILTVLFGLLLLISKRHKDEDDDEEDDETKQQTNNDDEEKEQEKKRGLFTRVLAVLIAIVSVVFFLVTEDLSLPWTWTDQWTIWMVVIGFVQIVVFFVGRKWKNVDDDEDEEAQQA